jgi:exodeoxyribonuclease VII large subunit
MQPKVSQRQGELPLSTAPSPRFLSVTQLNELVKNALEIKLNAYWVLGEISNFRIPPSGHCYFTLKDKKSQICAVMFRRQGNALPFVVKDGMEVFCFGRVSVYPARGDLQFYVERMEPRGQGALFLAFEKLKKKLAAQGLFAAERKRRLPFLPASIGIVTSREGAALRDMLRIFDDRFPCRRIVIRPVKVQGAGAATQIASAIYDLGRSGQVDVMIVGRGGGSLEDLWAFNEEIVARAIFTCPVPVVSAVGHEVDFTIADFVADHRAPTPTSAAEQVVPRLSDLVEQISLLEMNLLRCMQSKLGEARDSWRGLVKRLADPSRKLRDHQQRIDELSMALLRRFQGRCRQSKDSLAQLAGRLDALSPLAVLDRGYSIAHKLPDEKIVKDSAAVSVGDRLRLSFARGKSICRVEEKE